METTTSKKIIELLERLQAGARSEWYKRDDNARKRNYTEAKKELIEKLSIDPNAPINYEILEGYKKPSDIKKYINDDMQLYYIIINNDGMAYIYNEDMKQVPYLYHLINTYWNRKTESATRKEAKKIIIFTQEVKYSKTINEKREQRQALKSKISLKDRFLLNKDFYNAPSEPEKRQRYKIINNYYYNYKYKDNLYKNEIGIYIDKSGYIKEAFKSDLKNRFNTFKLDNAEKRLQPKKEYYKKLLNEKIKDLENFFIKECNKITSVKDFKILYELLSETYLFKGFRELIDDAKILIKKLDKMVSYWGGRLDADKLEKNILKLLNINIYKEYETNKHILKVESCLKKYIDNIEDYTKKEDFKKNYLNSEWCPSIIIKKDLITFDDKYIYFYKNNNINYDFKILIED